MIGFLLCLWIIVKICNSNTIKYSNPPVCANPETPFEVGFFIIGTRQRQSRKLVLFKVEWMKTFEGNQGTFDQP